MCELDSQASPLFQEVPKTSLRIFCVNSCSARNKQGGRSASLLCKVELAHLSAAGSFTPFQYPTALLQALGPCLSHYLGVPQTSFPISRFCRCFFSALGCSLRNVSRRSGLWLWAFCGCVAACRNKHLRSALLQKMRACVGVARVDVWGTVPFLRVGLVMSSGC